MLDYHIHTNMSDDSDTPYTAQAERAIRLGLKEICFTDHHDPDYTDPDFPFLLDFPKYHNMLEEAAERYYKDIIIKRGMELGIQSSCLDKCVDSARNYHYDFIIGSFHMVSGVPVDFKEFYEGKSNLEVQEEYYNYMLECVKEFKDYSVLGHINLVDRYQHLYMPGEPLNPPEVMEIIREVLKIVIYDGKGIEFNTSAFRYRTPVTLPTTEILKMYKELGGEIITLGSDAHTPEYIALNFREAADLIGTLGFRYVCSFNEMQPDFIKVEHL